MKTYVSVFNGSGHILGVYRMDRGLEGVRTLKMFLDDMDENTSKKRVERIIKSLNSGSSGEWV